MTEPVLSFLLADAAAPQGPPPWTGVVPMVLMFVIFYFLLIRPQQKKAKEHAELLKGLRPGDRVLTNGGVVGVVITVKDKNVMLRSADSKLEVLKTAVSEILERSGAGEAQTKEV